MQYWNRETSKPGQYLVSSPIIKEAKIICLSDPNDGSNSMIYSYDAEQGKCVSSPCLPQGVEVIAVGTQIDDFDVEKLKGEKPNVIFCSHAKAREPLAKLINQIPSIEWIHSRSAGIDYVTSPTLSNSKAIMTNAKGSFSSTLAEYTMMAIAYYAKDLPRLLQQKQDKNWSKYSVQEIRGSSLGIIGYGDIGRASATLAKAYGMKVVALRRNPALSNNDPCVDLVYDNSKESIHKVMNTCDYILISAPLTAQTKGMIDKEAFVHMNKNAVLINVGRGPIIDEDAMIEALKKGMFKGVALDVFATEPLPSESELWEMNNVLISPHNMDMTETFMHEATEFFVHENIPRFIRDETLLNPVDKAAGY